MSVEDTSPEPLVDAEDTDFNGVGVEAGADEVVDVSVGLTTFALSVLSTTDGSGV